MESGCCPGDHHPTVVEMTALDQTCATRLSSSSHRPWNWRAQAVLELEKAPACRMLCCICGSEIRHARSRRSPRNPGGNVPKMVPGPMNFGPSRMLYFCPNDTSGCMLHHQATNSQAETSASMPGVADSGVRVRVT
ncbi:hypothetical protein B0T16DRAFT_409256 [Cercophora newfieldiana]|uniref:Uncharacterized protein n=1 Tax=Cercophora newfieldiana TaxID=92897 RepID=A0AA39YAE8_9PEZI|nr:hypothetical protein B0T16DRAFT_409256 [Cercophora newfieldiana]